MPSYPKHQTEPNLVPIDGPTQVQVHGYGSGIIRHLLDIVAKSYITLTTVNRSESSIIQH
jgi:hypothetical protein